MVRKTTADKRREMTRGRGVNATTIWQMREEGSNEEGKNGKGNGNVMAMVAMDGAMVRAMDRDDGNVGDGRRNCNSTATEGTMAMQRQRR